MSMTSFNMNRSFVKRSSSNKESSANAANLSLRSVTTPDRSFVAKSIERMEAAASAAKKPLLERSPNQPKQADTQPKNNEASESSDAPVVVAEEPQESQKEKNQNGNGSSYYTLTYQRLFNPSQTSTLQQSVGSPVSTSWESDTPSPAAAVAQQDTTSSSFWTEWAEEVMKQNTDSTSSMLYEFDNEPSVSFFRLEQQEQEKAAAQKKNDKQKQDSDDDEERQDTSVASYYYELQKQKKQQKAEDKAAQETRDSSVDYSNPCEGFNNNDENSSTKKEEDAPNNNIHSQETSTSHIICDQESNSSDEEEEEEEESFQDIYNATMNTFDAMNITQATVTLPTEDTTTTTGTNNGEDQQNTSSSSDLSALAMEYSLKATELLQASQHTEALKAYRQAADVYEQQMATAGNVVAAVNAAGCFRNMSAVSRMLHRYDEAAIYLRQAEQLYVAAREGVAVHQAMITNDSNKNGSSSEISVTLDGKKLSNDDTEEFLCLDAMLLETMQFRAKFHAKYQEKLHLAVECHEQCLTQLLHLNKLKSWDNDDDESSGMTRINGITFTQLSKAQHTAMLVKSLGKLGVYYRQLVGEYKEPLVVFEDALDLLKHRQESEEPDNDDLIESVAQILRDMSEIYFHRQELDRSVVALHDSVCVTLTASGAPCPEAIATLNKMGSANEQMENYDKAMECYERVLFARSRYYGNTHVCVAKSLINVARVMELKDGCSSEESVDLYRAANAIFALQETPGKADVGEDAKAILDLIPTVIRQGRYEKAIEDLNKCLEMADDGEAFNGASLDKAQIYFDLGRAYIGLNDYKTATEYLVESVKEAGHVSDEEVFTMLQRVEFLQQRGKSGDDDKPDVVVEEGPTFSVHETSQHLQADSSMQNFEDKISGGAACNVIEPDPKDKTELESSRINPFHEILHQSFSAPVQKSKKAKIARSLRKSMKSLRKTMSPPRTRTQVHTRLAKSVAEKVRRMQKARSAEPKQQKEKLPPRFKLLRHKWCFLRGHDNKKNVVSPEKPVIPGHETVDFPEHHSSSSPWGSALSELTSTPFPPIVPTTVVTNPLPAGLRKVTIVEDEEGVEMAYHNAI